MRINLIGIFFLVLSASCFGQNPALMYTSHSGVSEDSIGVIKRIKSPVGKKVKVIYSNGQKSKILKSELWGFRTRSGRLYRLYDGKALRVVKQNDIVKYEYKQPGTTCYSRRYSANLDSPVVWTKRKARRM
jgi:hypothetical protein